MTLEEFTAKAGLLGIHIKVHYEPQFPYPYTIKAGMEFFVVGRSWEDAVQECLNLGAFDDRDRA